ncbi:MAG: hypothetical protein GXO88_06980 [Chlorobi bacterium]|nr:hypothetical protein [Chlorobiota bacterium]
MILRSCRKPGLKTISTKPCLLGKHFLLLFLSAILAFPCLTKSSNLSSNASSAEKIYLQLDSEVYTTDGTIWFKAIVTNVADHVPTKLSGVLYVELIDPNERVVEKKLVRLENGIGSGFFQLMSTYAEGLYLIRAYTQWNQNFGKDFFFKEYIRVFAATKEAKSNLITDVTLIEEQNNKRRLTATLDPFAIDSLHTKVLTLVLSLNDKKDTISIRKNRGNQYRLNYAIPDSCRFVTLQMQTRNRFSYTKTIALDKDYVDLQFLPESGEIVQGIPALVGFKALDCNGKGKKVEGKVVDGKGDVVTFFKSNELGMGSFTLASPDTATKYLALLIPEPEGSLGKMYPLPKVAATGNVLSVKKDGGAIHLRASSSYLSNDSITVWVSCRGAGYYKMDGVLEDGTLQFSLQADAFPEGIIAFTMMDHSMQPIAERLYFNERPGSRVNISLSTDGQTYEQREPTTLNIETKDSRGKPVNANLSVMVINKEQMGQMQNTRQNILSYFLLDSDLKGQIEDPGFYFKGEDDHYNDLDALLLTQGWRKYNYTKPEYKINFQPETTLTVSGTVKEAISKKRKKEVRLTMMAFGHEHSVQEQTADSLGRFCFDMNDEYGQNLNILIQSANKTGKKKECTITLDKKESPLVSFDHVKSIAGVDSVVHLLVEKNIERKKVDDAFPLSKGDILLDEITVKGYNMTPARKEVAEEYGKPDEVIEGKDIQEKEEKWSYGLFSVLFFNFPDKVRIGRLPDGNLYAEANNPEPTLFVVDGIPVKPYNYQLISDIPPSEVRSFEVIEYADNFPRLFCEVLPDRCIDWLLAPGSKTGNIIAIYTYAGKGLFGVSRTVGMLKTTVPVFSAPREFYAPTYENLQSEDWFKPDWRALIHWQPELTVDSLGQASSTFYNADNIGKMQVVVEALSDKGEIGYQVMEYEVVKRKY